MTADHVQSAKLMACVAPEIFSKSASVPKYSAEGGTQPTSGRVQRTQLLARLLGIRGAKLLQCLWYWERALRIWHDRARPRPSDLPLIAANSNRVDQRHECSTVEQESFVP